MENEKQGYSNHTLGAAARVREAQERARGGGIGGAIADRLAPSNQVGYAEGAATDRAYQAPLSVRIEQRLRNLANDAEELARIQEILKEHPEFETFLEFLSITSRRGLM